MTSCHLLLLNYITYLIRDVNDNNTVTNKNYTINLTINKYQIKKTYNLLTNNYISLTFINNKLIILNNPSNIDINKLLKQNYITFK